MKPRLCLPAQSATRIHHQASGRKSSAPVFMRSTCLWLFQVGSWLFAVHGLLLFRRHCSNSILRRAILLLPSRMWSSPRASLSFIMLPLSLPRCDRDSYNPYSHSPLAILKLIAATHGNAKAILIVTATVSAIANWLLLQMYALLCLTLVFV